MNAIEKYLDGPFCKATAYDPIQKCYLSEGQHYGGLLPKMAALHYPGFRRSRRRTKTLKKGSSRKEGIRVDQDVVTLVNGGGKKKKKIHPFATALVQYWTERKGHQLVRAQVPVRVARFDAVTQADCITWDPKKEELWMWEVKCGFAPGGSVKKGYLFRPPAQNPVEKVPSTVHNHWELQRYWTHKSFLEQGVPIVHSRVINVYRQQECKDNKKTKVVVKERKPPAWILQPSLL